MRYGKKGQVSIAVIIAVVIVLGVVAFFVFRGKGGGSDISEELAPVFSYYASCVEKEVKAGAELAGTQGGYLETGVYEPGSEYAPFSSQLNFLGFPVPYWYYISGNGIVRENVPSKNEIERQMERFVENRLIDCDFEEFAKKGIGVERGSAKAKVRIEDEKIIAEVDSELSASKGESSARRNIHNVEITNNFGKMYGLAKELYEKEKKEAFLEKYAEDVIRLNAPVDGVEISCSPKVWKYNEVSEEIKKGLEANIASIKLEGNYYTERSKEEKYFVVNKKTELPVNFMYSRNWPTKLEISGADGQLLIAEPIGNQAGLGALGFCYAPYHFVYDLSFPVLVQFYGQNGEIFQFPVAVIIDNNVPREAELQPLEEDEEDVDVCGFMTQDVEVRVYGKELKKLDANISYQCFDQTCRLGETRDGIYSGKAPACLNGQIIANAEGYARGKAGFSTNSESLAGIILDKEYEVELEIEANGKPIEGNALVVFSGETIVTTLVPESRKVRLPEGRFNLSVSIYGNSSIVIPASSKRECIEAAKGGVAGLLGGMEQKCFDINIPETKIEHGLIGGGKSESYLLPEMLEKGKLKIKAKIFAKPDSVEKMQENFILAENSGLEVGE